MSESQRSSGFTVGSLRPGAGGVSRREQEGPNWSFSEGEIHEDGGRAGYTSKGIARLTYNNPYGQTCERVWFDGKIVFAVELGEIDSDVTAVKVAQEYQIVYSVDLDERGKHRRDPELVPGQFNIYDSVPGMEKYSPLWQFNYVLVPRSYVPNTLRSEQDCLQSGYPIVVSTVVEN
jgi:hypothetical protein